MQSEKTPQDPINPAEQSVDGAVNPGATRIGNPDRLPVILDPFSRFTRGTALDPRLVGSNAPTDVVDTAAFSGVERRDGVGPSEFPSLEIEEMLGWLKPDQAQAAEQDIEHGGDGCTLGGAER